MLYCNRCGQCVHISDDHFLENRNTTGWEVCYLNPGTGDIEDYGDSENSDSDHDSYECPHCSSNDIEFDTSPTIEEAEEMRSMYTIERSAVMERVIRERESRQKVNQEWD